MIYGVLNFPIDTFDCSTSAVSSHVFRLSLHLFLGRLKNLLPSGDLSLAILTSLFSFILFISKVCSFHPIFRFLTHSFMSFTLHLFLISSLLVLTLNALFVIHLGTFISVVSSNLGVIFVFGLVSCHNRSDNVFSNLLLRMLSFRQLTTLFALLTCCRTSFNFHLSSTSKFYV